VSIAAVSFLATLMVSSYGVIDAPAYNGGGSWTTWDENATRALRFLGSMGCNLTRGLECGLSYNDPYSYLAEYRRRLGIAETFGLKVHVGIASYKRLVEEGVDLGYFKTQFLPVILQGLKNETRITCLDIDDEPDLADMDNLQFIKDVYTIVKLYDHNHPVSIVGWHYGNDWHNPIHLPIILDYVDWIGLHMYPPDGRGDGHIPLGLSAEEVKLETYNAYKAQIQACRAWGKPVIVTEYGINFELLKQAYSNNAEEIGLSWCWGALDAFQDSNIKYKIFYQLGSIPDEAFSVVSSTEGRHRVAVEIATRYLPKQVIRAPTSSPSLGNSLPEISVENLPLLRGFGEDLKLYRVYNDSLEAWDNYLTQLGEKFGSNVSSVRLSFAMVANSDVFTFLDFQFIDQLLQIFERHQVYAILDACHDSFIPLHYPDLFIEQWVEIAKYYKNSTVVLAYELWNEPCWGARAFASEIVQLLRQCYDAIRQVAPRKPVIFAAPPFTDDALNSQLLYGLPETFWSFHPYRKLLNQTEADQAITDIIAELKQMRNQHGTKPWIGEVGCSDLYGAYAGPPEVQDYFITKLVKTAVANEIGYAVWETISRRDRYDPLLPELFG
jgi:hypothetical protein